MSDKQQTPSAEGFGWHPSNDPEHQHSFDERNRKFTMRAGLTAQLPLEQPRSGTRVWTPGAITDQGRTPHCVGFTIEDWLYCSPIRHRAGSMPNGHWFYGECKKVDGYPHLEGSDSNAALKVARALGYVKQWVWADTWTEEGRKHAISIVRRWVTLVGPVWMGSWWVQSMNHPNADGVIRYDPAARHEMGHEFLVIGWSDSRQQFRLLNHWGRLWGQQGRAWIPGTDLEELLLNGGEAIGVLEQAVL